MAVEQLKGVKAILFDLDNTLIDTKGADRIACDRVCRFLEENGVKRALSQEVVQKFYDQIRIAGQDPSGRVDVDTWRSSLWSRSLGSKLKFYSDKVYRLWKEERKKYLGLNRNVQAMLHELRKHYKLGLITNGPSKAQWEKVEHVDAYQYFELVLVSGDHQIEKPSPFIFQLAFNHLGVKAKDCVMVGDKIETDIEGGVNAGVAATFLVCPKVLDWDDLDTKPDYIVKNVCDIMEILPLKGKQRRHSVKDRSPCQERPQKLCLAQLPHDTGTEAKGFSCDKSEL